MREKINKKNIGKLLLVLIVLVAELALFFSIRHIFYNNGYSTFLVPEENGEYILVVDGTEFECNFTSHEDNIRSFALQFRKGKSGEGNITAGVLTFTVSDTATGNVIRQQQIYCSSAHASLFTVVDMGEPITGAMGQDLTLHMSFSGVVKGEVYILCGETEDGQFFPTLKLSRAGNDAMIDSFWAIYGLLIGGSIFTLVYALFAKEFKIEKLYLVIGLTCSFAMSLVMPLMTGPDESNHSKSAYYVSNVMLGIENKANGKVPMRADDAEYVFADVVCNRNNYVTYYEDFFDAVKDDTIVDTDNLAWVTPYHLFFVQGLGITVGRLLGLGTVLIYMLGRWFNTVAFCLCIYHAMKRMPFGKAIMLVWACLPITLQQGMIFSYDGPILAMSSLIIGITLSFMYAPDKLTKKQKIMDGIILAACCLILAPCKSYALMPVVCFPLMLLGKYVYNRRDKIKRFFNEDKKRRIIFWIATAVMCVAVVAVVAVVLKSLMAGADGVGKKLTWTDGYAKPAGYYVKYPMELIKMLASTLFYKGETLILQTFGSILGWLNVNVLTLIVILFMMIFMFACIRKSDEEQVVSVASKTWMLIVFLLIVLFSWLGMLVAWTPEYSLVIEGVQGRYFLPALVLFGLALRTKGTSRSKDSDRVIAVLSTILVLVALSFVISYKI